VRDSAWAGVAAGATAVAFAPAVSGGFVYDDHGFYEANVALSKPSILWRAFTDPTVHRHAGFDAGMWRPMRTLSFALDKLLFGSGSAGPHAMSVCLHAASAALLFFLLRRLAFGTTASLSGALLFSLHPAQAECVAWISSRGDLLAMLFVFAAILLDLKDRAGLALVAGAAALLSKEQAVVWPALAWIASLLAKRSVREATMRCLAPIALVAASLVVRKIVGVENAQETRVAAPIDAMLGHQVWYALLPVGTLFDWQMPLATHPWPAVLTAALPLVALAARPTRLPALWFLAALVPTLFVQAFVPLNIAVCDRWLLFALPALAMIAATCVERAGPAPALVGALCFGALLETTIPAWRSDETLWTRVLARQPDNPRANHWVGFEALERGDFAQAVPLLRRSESPKGRFHLACALDALAFQTKDAPMMREAFVENRDADRLYGADPRAEGRESLQPLARVGAVRCALLYSGMTGEFEFAVEPVRTLLSSPRPPVPTDAAEGWRIRLTDAAKTAALNPLLGPAVADRIRAWGGLE